MKILIVDDEPDVVELITLTFNLQSWESKIIAAGDGETALGLFDEECPDVVVLDVGLSGMSGFEVCRRLRERSEVPILMLTVRGKLADRLRGLELGAGLPAEAAEEAHLAVGPEERGEGRGHGHQTLLEHEGLFAPLLGDHGLDGADELELLPSAEGRGHEGAAPPVTGDKPLGLQGFEGLADRDDADAVALGQLDLGGDPGGGRQLSPENLQPEDLGELVPEGELSAEHRSH